MQNPRLATRYAKSLMDIAKEQNALDAVYDDMQGFHNMIASSKELDSLLKSPVVSASKKNDILKAIMNGTAHNVTNLFTQLLTSKGRESVLGEIAQDFIKQYKELKNIITVKVTTSDVISEELKASLLTQITLQFKGSTVDLQCFTDPRLIGGFTLESNNKLFDASILRDLKDIQKQFLANEYVPEIN
jgi:F-type H+-transporting ATPase subunit delta